MIARRSGPPDDQALIVRECASRAIAVLLVNHQDSIDLNGTIRLPSPIKGLYSHEEEGDPQVGRAALRKASRRWVARYSPFDPRLYLQTEAKTISAPRLANGHDRLSAFASFVADESYGKESPSIWLRDLKGWLRKKRTISPDKLRRLSQATGASWVVLFYEARYIQHLVVAIQMLLSNKCFAQAAVLTGYVFRTWTFQNELTTLDLFAPEWGLFSRALPEIERQFKFWNTIPARVQITHVKGAELRSVFRLCEPSDLKFLPRRDPYLYPTVAVTKASMFLLSGLFPERFNPSNAKSLKNSAESIFGEA